MTHYDEKLTKYDSVETYADSSKQLFDIWNTVIRLKALNQSFHLLDEFSSWIHLFLIIFNFTNVFIRFDILVSFLIHKAHRINLWIVMLFLIHILLNHVSITFVLIIITITIKRSKKTFKHKIFPDSLFYHTCL